MSNEEQYLELKKKNLIRLVDNYNEVISNKGASEDEKFQIIDRNNLDIEKEFSRPELCKWCCGRCCTTSPCAFSPSDFLDITDVDYMKSILNTGLICIASIADEFDDNEILVLRPRGSAEPHYIINLDGIPHYIFEDPMNPCIFKSPNLTGCLLPPEYRPSEGLLRIPYERERPKRGRYDHINMYNKLFYKKEYQSYQEYLKYLVSEYKDVLFPIEDISVENDVPKLINSLIRK